MPFMAPCSSVWGSTFSSRSFFDDIHRLVEKLQVLVSALLKGNDPAVAVEPYSKTK